MIMTFDLLAGATTGPRAGLLRAPHGDVPTPVFMPVGTQATVKTLTPDELAAMGVPIVLANTYHLYLRPGAEVVARLGGLHKFMGWPRPILTDSGGFQVFSLGHLRRVSDDGVLFKSHVDGSEHFFSPELVMATQELLGADIVMALDECAPPEATYDYAQAAMTRTHRWAERCRAAQRRGDQALFGIVQGGMFADLRQESAQTLAALDFPGYGIGGLSVGEAKEVTWRMLDITIERLPPDRPRYLMGVGSPEDILAAVAHGVDMMDCVLPTRIARNGALIVRTGRLNIKSPQYTWDERPIEEGCGCYTCQHFSRAYLRHLFKAEEILGLRLMTIHNVYFLVELMRQIRQAILEGRFAQFQAEFLAGFQPTDPAVQAANKARWLARARQSPDHIEIQT
ncbi:MAG: tRNA guanosine(34) transglycosylase Tgt [Chloroflexi bacterium]|nr:tRNA guanosine(34) transglycosylase Tgt [Chloroflexota bacterium]